MFFFYLYLTSLAIFITYFWRKQWHPTPVLLPGKSHGWRSLVGCSPGGCEESGTIERLPFHFSLSCIGEGNGNPLQCFCLENPRDGGAWWAAMYGVTQSQTRLKWLSSSRVNFTFLKIVDFVCSFFFVCARFSKLVPYASLNFIYICDYPTLFLILYIFFISLFPSISL